MRVLTIWGLALLVLATGFGAAAATQGCDDCREIKKEYRDSALAKYTPAAAQPTVTPSVRAVLYWSEECGHCEDVLDGVLPRLQEQYGAQLDVRLVEVVSLEDISAFFDVAEGYGFPRGKAAVPFLLIGDNALIGVDQISAELPGLIEIYLAAGETDWLNPQEKRVAAQIATPAAAGCAIATPCADASGTPFEASPSGAELAGIAPPTLVAFLCVAVVTGGSLATFLGHRALRRRARASSPAADTWTPISGDNDAT